MNIGLDRRLQSQDYGDEARIIELKCQAAAEELCRRFFVENGIERIMPRFWMDSFLLNNELFFSIIPTQAMKVPFIGNRMTGEFVPKDDPFHRTLLLLLCQL